MLRLHALKLGEVGRALTPEVGYRRVREISIGDSVAPLRNGKGEQYAEDDEHALENEARGALAERLGAFSFHRAGPLSRLPTCLCFAKGARAASARKGDHMA